MGIPLKWTEGDLCTVERDGTSYTGTIASIGEGCAEVKSGTRTIFAGLAELELVPIFDSDSAIAADRDEPALDARPILRTCAEDGTHHFSDLKHLALSGVQYLHAVNTPPKPTRAMLIGTVVHLLLLGTRTGAKPIVCYRDGIRSGKKWDEFVLKHPGAEIVTAKEWNEAERIAEGVRRSELARARFEGARLEVPLVWEENGIRCSTSGIDLLCAGDDIGDLKATATTHPETFKRHAFKMFWPQQLAFYRRGALANGLNPRRLFILGVESRAPFEVVPLDLTENLIEYADKVGDQSVERWLERLRVYRDAVPEPRSVYDWPGYTQAPVLFDVPPWLQVEEDEEEEAEEDEAAA